jgi:hypothetical protein
MIFRMTAAGRNALIVFIPPQELQGNQGGHGFLVNLDIEQHPPGSLPLPPSCRAFASYCPPALGRRGPDGGQVARVKGRPKPAKEDFVAKVIAGFDAQ